jgi:hypothetical protein
VVLRTLRKLPSARLGCCLVPVSKLCRNPVTSTANGLVYSYLPEPKQVF